MVVAVTITIRYMMTKAIEVSTGRAGSQGSRNLIRDEGKQAFLAVARTG